MTDKDMILQTGLKNQDKKPNKLNYTYLEIIHDLMLNAKQGLPLETEHTFYEYAEYLIIKKKLNLGGISCERTTEKNKVPVIVMISLEHELEELKEKGPAMCMKRITISNKDIN